MPSAREPSGVIAQLAGVQHRNRRSPAPSPRFPGLSDVDNSTVDTFQPDHESTQQFETAADEQSLAPGHNFANDIDSSDEEAFDQSISIEVGRGAKTSARASLGRHTYGADFSEEQLLDLGDDSLYDMPTPPVARKSLPRQDADLRKQASIRRAQVERDSDFTKISDIVPSKTRQAKPTARRTLSDMHAKVNALSDSSFILPNDNPTRQSRFSKPRAVSGHEDLPTRFTAGAGLNRATGQTPRRPASAPDTSLIGNQTAQSFMLPDLPNIAELVSGVRKDGTPVFSRTAKPKSRFTSASYSRGVDSTVHVPVHSLPLPDDEKAIFTSLQLLQAKVAKLEAEKGDAVNRADELENEIIALKSQVQMERRLRRHEGGLATDEERRAFSEWSIERGQLQAALRTAQERLEKSTRKFSTSDVSVKRITQERDSLITQLGVAFYSNEELKEESAQLQDRVAALEDENADLQDEIAHLRESNTELKLQLQESEQRHDSDLRQWVLREAELQSRSKRHSMRVEEPIQPRKEKNEMRRRSATSDKQDAQSRILERVEHEVRKARAEAVRQSKPASKAERREKSTSKSRSRSRPADDTDYKLPLRNISGNANRDRWLDEQASIRASNEKPVQQRAKLEQDDAVSAITEDSKDMTYISFLDPAELSALRKKLEAERLASKGRAEPTSAPRKSSMKDLGADFDVTTKTTVPNRAVRVQSPGTADAISYSSPDDVGDISMASTTSRRPQRTKSFEEMTSAFFLPDITVRTGPTADKPLPASERDVDASIATVRPAQDPQDALASVVAQLQDEVAHLKTELGKTEKEYERCDPAVGKHKRLATKARMEALVAEVEKRSEQVYALFDVLEGQKRTASFDEDVEETLQSIAVDLEEVRRRAAREVGEVSGLSL